MPGVTLTDHLFSVPLDHDRRDGEHIEIYAREVVAAGRERERLPWLLFLQGGPGMVPPRPVGRDSWLDRELTGEPWSVLGQSFGGMCTVTYLSFAPEGLREAIITGGLPGLRVTADEVYRAAYPRVHRKNTAYYRRYPQDAASVRRIAAHLIEHPAPMPDGSLLTVEAFQSLGMMLGMSDGAGVLHYLAANDVPVAAAVYLDDMCVDATYSLQTAETIRGLRLWATNEHEHDGLRASGGRVIDRLLRMLNNQI
jgi:hypothetical protein